MNVRPGQPRAGTPLGPTGERRTVDGCAERCAERCEDDGSDDRKVHDLWMLIMFICTVDVPYSGRRNPLELVEFLAFGRMYWDGCIVHSIAQ